ncbi:MAG: hypothetical protein R6U98_10405 [Pirellulaceae bacterium]
MESCRDILQAATKPGGRSAIQGVLEGGLSSVRGWKSCPTQAVLSLVGLPAEQVIRDWCIMIRNAATCCRLPPSARWPFCAHLFEN